jgi:Ca2+-binding EF-hand superfamily protein
MRPLSDDEFRFAIRLNHANEIKPFGHLGSPTSGSESPKNSYSNVDLDFSRSSSFSTNLRNRSQSIGTSGGDINLKLDFSDFIVLELLRLRKVEMSDLEHIKRLFDEIDDDGEGIIDKRKLRKHQVSRGLASNHNTEKIDNMDIENSNSNKSSVKNSDNIINLANYRSHSASPERSERKDDHVEHGSYYESLNCSVIDAAYSNIELAIKSVNSGSEDDNNNNIHSNDEYNDNDDIDIDDDETLFLNQMKESYNSSVIPLVSHISKKDDLTALFNRLHLRHTDEHIENRNYRNRDKHSYGQRRRSNTVTCDDDNRRRMISSTNCHATSKFTQPKRSISFTSPTKFPPSEKDRLLN